MIRHNNRKTELVKKQLQDFTTSNENQPKKQILKTKTVNRKPPQKRKKIETTIGKPIIKWTVIGLRILISYVCSAQKNSKPKRTKNVNNPRTRMQISNEHLVLEPPCRPLQCPERTEKGSLPPNKWRWMKDNKFEHPVPCCPQPEEKKITSSIFSAVHKGYDPWF